MIYFEHFWSIILQRTILQFYIVSYVELNVNSLKFHDFKKLSFDSNDWLTHGSMDTKLSVPQQHIVKQCK